jgi:hypothetical protein
MMTIVARGEKPKSIGHGRAQQSLCMSACDGKKTKLPCMPLKFVRHPHYFLIS